MCVNYSLGPGGRVSTRCHNRALAVFEMAGRGGSGVSPKLLERNQSVVRSLYGAMVSHFMLPSCQVLLESDVAMAVIRTDLDSLVNQCSPLNKASRDYNVYAC